MLAQRPVPFRLLLLSLAGSAGILACTLTYPFNNDNALFAYMSALLLEGRLPYIGSWDQNFPGILLVHTPQILLLGRSQLAFHVWDVLLQLFGAYYLFRLGLRWGGRMAGFLAPLLGAFYYVQQGLWMAGERDAYISVLMVAAIYYVTDRYRVVRATLLAGVLVGLAMLFRPTFGLLVPALLIYLYAALEGRARNLEMIRALLGSALPTAALVVIYLLAGGLGDLYDATVRFNANIYLGQGSVFSFWEPVRFYAALLPFAAYGVWLLWQRDRPVTILLLLCLCAGVASIVLLYRHSVYHYHPAMTIFLLVGAMGLGRAITLLQDLGNSRAARISICMAAVAVVIAFFSVQTLRGNTIKRVLADMMNGKITSLGDAYAHYEGSPTFGVDVQRAVGEYLISHTSPGEAVQMFGPYSYPQYLSHTSTASRFQTLHALTMRREGGSLLQQQIAWREEYRAELGRVRPKYFIVCDAPEAFRQFYGGRLGHEILREDMTDVGTWLMQNYSQDTVIGAFTLYKINEAH